MNGATEEKYLDCQSPLVEVLTLEDIKLLKKWKNQIYKTSGK